MFRRSGCAQSTLPPFRWSLQVTQIIGCRPCANPLLPTFQKQYPRNTCRRNVKGMGNVSGYCLYIFSHGFLQKHGLLVTIRGYSHDRLTIPLWKEQSIERVIYVISLFTFEMHGFHWPSGDTYRVHNKITSLAHLTSIHFHDHSRQKWMCMLYTGTPKKLSYHTPPKEKAPDRQWGLWRTLVCVFRDV